MMNKIYGSAKTMAKASAIGMTFIAHVKHKVAMIKKTFRNRSLGTSVGENFTLYFMTQNIGRISKACTRNLKVVI